MTRQTTTQAGLVRLSILATIGALFIASCDRPSTNGDDQPSTSTEQTDPLQLPFPEEIIDPPWLESRRQAQLETEFEVFCDFAFSDQLEDSAIRFRNRITPDSGRNYRPNHYDHGNGIAIADVDGDGLYDIYSSPRLATTNCGGIWEAANLRILPRGRAWRPNRMGYRPLSPILTTMAIQTST